MFSEKGRKDLAHFEGTNSCNTHYFLKGNDKVRRYFSWWLNRANRTDEKQLYHKRSPSLCVRAFPKPAFGSSRETHKLTAQHWVDANRVWIQDQSQHESLTLLPPGPGYSPFLWCVGVFLQFPLFLRFSQWGCNVAQHFILFMENQLLKEKKKPSGNYFTEEFYFQLCEKV